LLAVIQVPQLALGLAFTIARKFSFIIQKREQFLDELRNGGWRKLIFRRWKIVYTIRDDDIIIGRVWPAAMGEADLETPL